MEQLPLFEGLPAASGSQPSHTESPASKPVRAKAAPSIPPEVIVASVELMGAIDLDPYCINEATTLVPAKIRYGTDANALALEWGPKRRRVFLNPPAGRATPAWINKLCDEYEAGNVGQGIAYLRASLDSDWWNRLIVYPICIVHRQLRVAAGIQNITAPWAVVYLGTNIRGFAEAFGEVGALYVPYEGQIEPSDQETVNKPAAHEHHEANDLESGGPQTIQQGDYVLTVHASASYVSLAHPHWDTPEQNRLRRLILNIPGVLPSQYSSISKSRDGTIKLIFSFKKGFAQSVVGDIKKLLAVNTRKSKRT